MVCPLRLHKAGSHVVMFNAGCPLASVKSTIKETFSLSCAKEFFKYFCLRIDMLMLFALLRIKIGTDECVFSLMKIILRGATWLRFLRQETSSNSYSNKEDVLQT